jgi:D-alanine-D-alanine ligase-like ATP-grasp enzyme
MRIIIEQCSSSELKINLRMSSGSADENNYPTVFIVFGAKDKPSDATQFDRNIELSNRFCDPFLWLRNLQKALVKAGFSSTFLQPVTLENYKDVLGSLFSHQKMTSDSGTGLAIRQKTFIVMNMCDGAESFDGYPGRSILCELENLKIPYTGADLAFYDITTSKVAHKRVLQSKGVLTSPFVLVDRERIEDCIREAEYIVGFPMIIKVDISYASLNISEDCVVSDFLQAVTRVRSMFEVIKNDQEVFVEKFFPGREFTAFITGGEKFGVHVYPALERVFHPRLSGHQRLLAFDSYYSVSIDENLDEPIYGGILAPKNVMDRIKKVAKDAYLAVGGSGYARVDIRTDKEDLGVAELFVLEVNSNCGVSFNPDNPRELSEEGTTVEKVR